MEHTAMAWTVTARRVPPGTWHRGMEVAGSPVMSHQRSLSGSTFTLDRAPPETVGFLSTTNGEIPPLPDPPPLRVGEGLPRRRERPLGSTFALSLALHVAAGVVGYLIVSPVTAPVDGPLMLGFMHEVRMEEETESPPPPPPAVEEPLPDPEPPEEFPPESVSPPVDLPAGAFVDDRGVRDDFAAGLGSRTRRRRAGRVPEADGGPGDAPVEVAPAPPPTRPTGPRVPDRRAHLLPDLCDEPGYPALSRSRGEEGRVVLLVDIGPDGVVTAVEVAVSSGHELLDGAAVKAVLLWRFEPALLDGRAVSDRIRLPVRFELDG